MPALLLALSAHGLNSEQVAVPILVYHRFGPTRVDSMTVTTKHFKEQLDLLCANNFTVIPLAKLIAWRLGRGPAPLPGSLVLTFDDGHISVYREAKNAVVTRRLPVTLFIYPSCISHASYAMTWDELRELTATSFFDVQSHTYWHPNFKDEAKKLDAQTYVLFAANQFQKSKEVLEGQLHRPVTLLAWPFGIYDSFLMDEASRAGYKAAFSIDCRAVTSSDPVLALPRCLVSDEYIGSRFFQFLKAAITSARNQS